MYRIATEPHADILSVKSDVRPCLADIINKVLAKPMGERYHSGAEMAEAIRQCMASLR